LLIRAIALRLALVAVAGCQACAKVEPPPGGPPDVAPPQIVAVQPESGAVVPQLRGDAVIRFDEVIDEMAGGAGSDGLGRFVLLSPVRGEVRVSWGRSEIHVRPKEGWKPGRVYRLELRPGIVDLRRNVLKEGRVILFSTGPAIPRAAMTGTVVQWVEQRAAPDALVRAALLPDSVAYLTLADSAGQFRLAGIPPGRYHVVGVIDQNRNFVRDLREAYDSTIMTVDSIAETALWTFVHDTVGPRTRSADFVDSITARVTFSQPLDPASPIDSTRVRVVALPDSAPVLVRAVLHPTAYDSLLARERAAAAAADSARAASDTTRRRPDSTRARPPAPGERRAGKIAPGPE
jgi:hypothetical protein